MNAPVRVGVIGATGLVGTEMLRVLEERKFPVAELRVFASTRSSSVRRRRESRRRRRHRRRRP